MMWITAEDLSRLAASNNLENMEAIAEVKSHPKEEQFRLLMEQSLMELPIAPFLNNTPQFKQWFSQLQLLAPEIWSNEPNTWKIYGQLLQFPYNNVTLSTKIDFLIYRYQQLEIINWTTHCPEDLENVLTDWKPQLDLFILAQTESYLPSQIRMTYWFLQEENDPIKVSRSYSMEAYQAFQDQLEQVLPKISPPDVTNSFPVEDTLTQFLTGKISINNYLDSIPEIEI